jgi:hypothetical protein
MVDLHTAVLWMDQDNSGLQMLALTHGHQATAPTTSFSAFLVNMSWVFGSTQPTMTKWCRAMLQTNSVANNVQMMSNTMETNSLPDSSLHEFNIFARPADLFRSGVRSAIALPIESHFSILLTMIITTMSCFKYHPTATHFKKKLSQHGMYGFAQPLSVSLMSSGLVISCLPSRSTEQNF